VALLRLLEEGFFDARCTWFLFARCSTPRLSPDTRENFAGVDLTATTKSLRAAENRRPRGVAAAPAALRAVICAHEDWEVQGFFISTS